jgi:diamine N-acetyltransferase
MNIKPSRIRKAELSDASSIAAISIEVWIGTYLKRGVAGFFADHALEQFTASKIEETLSAPGKLTFVSQNEEGIDGFITLSFDAPAPVQNCPVTEIATFYVQPRHHGRGIGKGLLEVATNHCRDIGIRSLWLATNAENSPAIAFYLSQGFEHIGETFFRIQDQAYKNNVYRLEFAEH